MKATARKQGLRHSLLRSCDKVTSQVRLGTSMTVRKLYHRHICIKGQSTLHMEMCRSGTICDKLCKYLLLTLNVWVHSKPEIRQIPKHPGLVCEFPAQRPVTRSFDVFVDMRLNKVLSKQSRDWWLETLSHSLWRHCNYIYPRSHDGNPSSSSILFTDNYVGNNFQEMQLEITHTYR